MKATTNAHHATLAPPRSGAQRSVRQPRRAARAPVRQIVRSPYLLIPLVILGLALRLHGLNWDAGYHLHPDERFITTVITDRIMPDWPPQWGTLLDPGHSPLNPRSDDPTTGQPRDFAYGSLPLFITKAVAGIMQLVTHVPWTDYNHVYLVGRVLSAVLDIGTLLLVYALARRYGRAWANLAALLLALCVLHIQLAHFFATDSWVTFFATAAVLAFVRAAERGETRDFVLGGALIGAAVASKASVAFLVFPALAAIGVLWWRSPRTVTGSEDATAPLRALFLALTTFWSALIVFAVCEPYALFRLNTYLTAIGTQAKLVRGDLDYPYTRQYVGTGLIYHVKNLVLWGMGPALGALALIGFVWAIPRVLRHRATADIVLLAWVVPYIAYTLPQSVKFMRYLQPIYPALIVLGVALLRDVTAVRHWRIPLVRSDGAHIMRFAGRCLTAGVVMATALWALAFSTIYDQTHSRVAASEGMVQNIPASATVATEVWDDPLPLSVPGAPTYGCLRLNPNNASSCSGLDLYPDEGSGELRLQYLARALAQSDYIVESSNRLYGSIPKLPWRYPMTIRYYDLLFAGQLGFTKVYDETVSPHLGPWQIHDQQADESFTVYDHPRVIFFKKTQTLTLDQLRPLFSDVINVHALSRRDISGKSLLLNQPVETLPVVSDRAWAGDFGRHAIVAIAAYLFLFELFGVIGWAVASRIFRAFPDRGWGLAKLIGWGGCAYLVWIGASLGVISFTLPWCLAALAVALGCAVVVLMRQWQALRAQIRTAWPMMLATEGITLTGFALFLAFRFKNPDLWQTYWGGEKAFELAHLNAILRSAHFPPYDPWFSGGYINYYYFGSYLHAFAMKLTGIPTEVAFNVALPVTMALAWGAASSVGAALWLLVRRRAVTHITEPIVGGVAAAVAVGLLGNLGAFGQVMGSLRDGLGLRGMLERFDFWASTRVIPGTINEFPFFTGLYADLHAHAIALPFTLLAVGTSIALAMQWRNAPLSGQWFRHLPWLGLVVAGLTVGMLYCTNAWDFPTAVALIFLGLIAGIRSARISWPRALVIAGMCTVSVAALGVIAYLPFFTHFQSLYGSVALVRQPSPLGPFLVIFGLQCLIISLGIGLMRPAQGWFMLLARDRRCAAIAVTTALATLLAAITHRLVLVVTLPLLGFLAILWLRADRDPGRRVAYGIAAAGLGILSVIELVFLADDLIGGDFERMNTVFKFDFQAWTLLALAMVAFVALAWERRRVISSAFQVIGTTVLVVGVIASLFYPIFGTPVRLQQRMSNPPVNAGLYGFAWMASGTLPADQFSNSSSGEPVGFADDLKLIDWLDANVRGTPVIAEATIGPYRGNGSRISSATGLPTIIGWERHEEQQRDRGILPARVEDVRTIYTSTESRAVQDVLDRYHVDYIVVGEVERKTKLAAGYLGARLQGESYASPEGLSTLAAMAASGTLRVAWQSNDTILYQVIGGWREGATNAG